LVTDFLFDNFIENSADHETQQRHGPKDL